MSSSIDAIPIINTQAYKLALQQPVPESRRMADMAQYVAQTLASAYQPIAVNAPIYGLQGGQQVIDQQKVEKIKRLRVAIQRMVEALQEAINQGHFQDLDWHQFKSDPTPHPLKQSVLLDDLALSVRSKMLTTHDPDVLQAMENALNHPLHDKEKAKELLWLAKSQLLHHAILAIEAQANIDEHVAQAILRKS
jgi:hypothetical protein